MAKDDKKSSSAGKDEKKVSSAAKESSTVKMIWPHKKLKEGEIRNCFGLPGVANEDGFLVVECSKERAKNEMTRKPKCLIPLELHERKKELEAETAKAMEEL